MVVVLVSYVCVCPEFLYCITVLDAWDKISPLAELMVEHVSKNIQFGLLMLVVGVYFVVWVLLSLTCSD